MRESTVGLVLTVALPLVAVIAMRFGNVPSKASVRGYAIAFLLGSWLTVVLPRHGFGVALAVAVIAWILGSAPAFPSLLRSRRG